MTIQADGGVGWGGLQLISAQ